MAAHASCRVVLQIFKRPLLYTSSQLFFGKNGKHGFRYLANPSHFGDVGDALQAHYAVLTKHLEIGLGGGSGSELRGDNSPTPKSVASKDQLDKVSELAHFRTFAEGKKF